MDPRTRTHTDRKGSDKHDRTAASPTNATHPRDAARVRRLLGEGVRGGVFFGAGFLLASCSLLLGVAPLGLALLSAASSYTWYIFAGVLTAAFVRPVELASWAWVGVYALCVILRLCIRFFVDPPVLPDGRPCRGRTYLLLCWVSFKRNLGLCGERDPDTAADYYAGADGHPNGRRRPPEGSDIPPRGAKTPELHLFGEHPFLRMLTAAVCAFAAGLIGLIAGGFHLYDLLGLFLLLAVTPLATFLLVSCFGEAGLVLLFSPAPLRDAPRNAPPCGKAAEVRAHSLSDRDGGVGRLTARFHTLPLLAVAFLITAATLAARPLVLSLGTPYLSLEVSTLLALLLSLFATARLGVVPGVAVAVMVGLAADARLAPVFILAAGGYALVRYVSHRAGVIGGVTVGAVWCATVEGMAVMVTQLPAILLTIPLYLLTERLWEALPTVGGRVRADRELEDFTAQVTAALTAETRAEAQRARMRALSEAFGTLSRKFYDLSSQLRRPRMLDLRRICDESFGKQCAHCRLRDVCWGMEYDRTLEVQARLAARLHTGGRASAEALPDSLRDFCPHMEAIVEDINARCARMTAALLRSEKTEVVAADYAALAAILGDALEDDRFEAEMMECNRDAADRIYDALTERGVGVQGVVVCGKRDSGRRRVILRGVGLEGLREDKESLAGIEEICGVPLATPTYEPDEGDGGTGVLTLYSEALLSARFSGSTVPAEQDCREPLPSPLTDETPAGTYDPPAVCGDHIALFRTDNAYFYALISDGMGSGEEASLTSDICAMFLERMLMAGNRVEISLKMLDGYLRSKNSGTGEECSATVDLMELDLMDGQAVFAKSGAAPTYIVRDGTVYKLRSRSLPLGILRDTPPELLRFRMHPGDVVVMVSDGVTQGQDECPWLIDLLSTPMPESMDSLRRDIIRRALSSGSEDDLSAIAIRVEDAS